MLVTERRKDLQTVFVAEGIFDTFVGFFHKITLTGNTYLFNVTFYISKNRERIFMSADLSVSWHYVVTLRRGRTRTRPREQLLLQNYKA